MLSDMLFTIRPIIIIGIQIDVIRSVVASINIKRDPGWSRSTKNFWITNPLPTVPTKITNEDRNNRKISVRVYGPLYEGDMDTGDWRKSKMKKLSF